MITQAQIQTIMISIKIKKLQLIQTIILITIKEKITKQLI
jgi:hypothetical protein